ncbi:MAG: hypothetical protein IT303_18200 [Dehalococcoidia bacterium]|nr:hypothetical protein [Dehalococcoidia bacterium]
MFVAFDSVCEVRLRDHDARLPAATDDDARLEAVLGEAGAMAAPIIDALVLRKEIAAANAWAVLLDAFSSAAAVAATATGEAEAVWARWRRLLELCPYPAKRRPRRFEYDGDGERLEVTVRASCCLFFTSESAKASPDPYCKLCYIESDANRVRRLRG